MIISSSSRFPVLLSGPMGAGKSTVGPLAAAALGLPFEDLDRSVEALAGATIAEIFARSGERGFREIEVRALRARLARGAPGVVALGGGSLTDPVLRAEAYESSLIIGLEAPPSVLAARVGSAAGRPLLTSPAEDLEGRISEIVEQRASVYRATHALVDAGAGSPDDVAAKIVAAARDRYVPVPIPGVPYAVRFTDSPFVVLAEAVAALRPSSTFLVSDENVISLYGPAARSALAARGIPIAGEIVFPVGEEHKRLAEVERALAALVAGGADRGSLILSLGGGVTSDMAGLTASLFARGIRWVAVPTTLLAMVDASVGGKTGVDFGSAKNLVGSIHQPRAVIVAPALSRTESPRALQSGLAELVKSLAIGDVSGFEACERAMASVPAAGSNDLWSQVGDWLGDAVVASVAVKAGIVGRDPAERGERAILNFGHTMGHALEATGGFARWTHGEAVSMGMVAACRVGSALGVTSPGLGPRIKSLLAAVGLPTEAPRDAFVQAIPRIASDKKRIGGTVRLALLVDLGVPKLVDVPLAELLRLLDELSPELCPTR